MLPLPEGETCVVKVHGPGVGILAKTAVKEAGPVIVTLNRGFLLLPDFPPIV